MRTVVFLALVVFGGGCVPDYGYVTVDYVPSYYDRYPRTYYDGRVVYYIDGRWYARHRDSWVYYRREPPELYRYRSRVEQAPPAYRSYPRDRAREPHRAPPARRAAPPARHAAPPARHSAPPARQSAPPAERVR